MCAPSPTVEEHGRPVRGQVVVELEQKGRDDALLDTVRDSVGQVPARFSLLRFAVRSSWCELGPADTDNPGR